MAKEEAITKEKICEYRGKIPLDLVREKGKIVYVCSSNKNLEDYYGTILQRYSGKIVKIENFGETNEKNKINYDILDTVQNHNKYIFLLSLEGFLSDFYPQGNTEEFVVGTEKSMSTLEKTLVEYGYTRKYMIENRKEFSIRGDILDIFPINGEDPVRVEFFDNTIERINYFDINTQKSIEKLDKIDLYLQNKKENAISFLEMISPLKSIKIYYENSDILLYKKEEIILRSRESENNIEDRIEARYLELVERGQEIETKIFTEVELESYRDLEHIKKIGQKQNITIYTNEEKRYTELLLADNKKSKIKIIKEPYFQGYRDGKELVLTDRELKGVTHTPRATTRKKLQYTSVTQIREGDYIIHKTFGVGQYLGIEVIDGHDHLKIRYADQDRLYVPVENLTAIEKYICTPGVVPDIYKLGRRGFKKKKEALKEEMIKFAHEIIELQAKREKGNGFVFSPDTVWQEEFEEGFPYKETPSQQTAIDDVKKDMESGKIMDRVVCGDVGYGKTEVALRASFKATIDRKQVAIMVPTTVLAQQHYERFRERFQNYDTTIECLSRIKTTKEQKAILNKVRMGLVDIIIGTHRLISDDVCFKDLGLLIIDEEQKFGVKAKEKLKKMKENVNVLSLTATPIPRTLNMSMLGIRDLSIIDTPPEGRKPITTEFIENDNNIIKDAIMAEVSREGQVFYVYNHVASIERRMNEVKKLLPSYIKVDFVHGKMQPTKIREKLQLFEDGDIDVLFATTIIENGIDIENANTMIIEGTEKLGLSQIYQLRGRIGRSERSSFCYLIYSKSKSEATKEREAVIQELRDLGGGMKLSIEDMRIRGAGEILGDKQHGALDTFGFDMYIKMLREEMAKIKGEKPAEEKEDIIISVRNHGYIPDDYIEKDQKLVIYKRMVEIDTIKGLDNLEEEIKDRFGKLPEETVELFDYLKVKILATDLDIEAIHETDDEEYEIAFNQTRMNDIKRQKLIDMIHEEKLKPLKNKKDVLYTGKLLDFFEIYDNISMKGTK